MRRLAPAIAARLRLWLLCAFACAVAACAFALPAAAQSRAWLDRDRIRYDETVVLNLEVDTRQASGLPDVSALSRDFSIVGQDMRQQLDLSGGDVSMRVSMMLVLQPRRSGQLQIPMLRIGSEVTPPLRLTVLPPPEPQAAPQAPPDAVPGTPAFIETRVDSVAPYVQQTLGYTIRLYYISGSILDGRIDQDQPEGASLQKFGDDLQLSQRVGNDDYSVVERRFLLVPERGGTVTIPPARFQGRSIGLFDGGFEGRREEFRLLSDPVVLQVKPIPAAAPQPWLPLRGLRLRYLEAPRTLRVGQSASIVIEAVADAATAAQLPALALQAGDGAQVFSEPAETRESFVDGRLQATVVRRFSVLPARDGTLRIAGPSLRWWDTQANVARTASLPDLMLPVAPDATGIGPSAAPTAGAEAGPARSWLPANLWRWALPALAVLWLGALALGWRLWTLRRRTSTPGIAGRESTASTASAPGGAASGMPAPAAPPQPDPQTLARVLAHGNAAEIARTLCAMASPPAADLEALRRRLADPAQLQAVEALLRARWGRGDAAAAVAAARAAFANGPRWRAPAARAASTLLPPLYPNA